VYVHKVAGRKSGEQFETLGLILSSLTSIPQPIKDMFIEIPQDAFRVDLSSTEIRNAMKKAEMEKNKGKEIIS
jgi:phage terminase Nu1 subunit (DNA packaging protein)